MSGSRKRTLSDDSPSAADNGKVKMRKDDGQALREIEPFDSIDDVTSEFHSIKNYVAPVKGDEFQKILDRLDKTDTLGRRNQGQEVASNQRIISMDDITELRILVSLHVAKSVMAEFDELLEKMGSEDRVIRKHSNHTENSNHEPEDVDIPEQQEPLQHENREEMGVVVGKAAKEGRLDNYGEVVMDEGVDGMQNNCPSDPKEEQVEVDEQPNAREPDENEQDDAAIDNSNREQLSFEVDKARLCFIDPPKEEYVDVPVHEMDVRDVPQLVEPVPKIEPLEGDEQRIDPAVDADAEQLESNAPTLVQQLNHGFDGDVQSMPSAQIEDPDELSDHLGSASDGDVMERDNEGPEQLDSDNGLDESDDEPEEDSDDSSGSDDDDAMETDNEEHNSMESEEEESGQVKMSSEEIQRRFGHLSDGELFHIMLTKYELTKSAHTAFTSKAYRNLNSFVVEADNTATLSVQGEIGSEKVVLNEGRNFGCRLVRLIRFALTGYDRSRSAFEFKSVDYGTSLPFQLLHPLYKLVIGELRMSSKELAPILRYVRPKYLYVAFPSAHLFSNDGTSMVDYVSYIELSSDEVDNVDKLMECHTCSVKLAPNSHWSDESFKKVLKAFMLRFWCHPSKHVVCHYTSCHNGNPNQRTITQWRKLCDDCRASYKGSHRTLLDDHITMNTSCEETITFEFRALPRRYI